MAQTIYEKIENKGRNDALEIKKNGEEKAERLKNEVLEKTEKVIHKMVDNAKEEAKETLKTKYTEFAQMSNQSTLKNRKEIIKMTFEKAFERMSDFSDDELFEYVVKLLKNSQIAGNEVIKVSSSSRRRYQKLFSKKNNNELDILNKELGDNFSLKMSNEDALIDGGFILESEYFDIDYSYRTVLKDLMSEVETELAKILFEG